MILLDILKTYLLPYLSAKQVSQMALVNSRFLALSKYENFWVMKYFKDLSYQKKIDKSKSWRWNYIYLYSFIEFIDVPNPTIEFTYQDGHPIRTDYFFKCPEDFGGNHPFNKFKYIDSTLEEHSSAYNPPNIPKKLSSSKSKHFLASLIAKDWAKEDFLILTCNGKNFRLP